MTDSAAKAAAFLELHMQDRPLLLANAWDLGSAALLSSLGFQALASTSSGYASTLGRLDYSLSREEAVGHASALAAATDLPLSADFEDCFAANPDGVAETVRLALDAGLAGCSIEDWDAANGRLYAADVAAERVAAAADAAHAGSVHLVLTARAENYLRGNPDLDDTIARLQAYQEAGADVLYAPGLARSEDIRALVESVALPLNVLARANVPPFAFAGLGAVVGAATELMTDGTYDFTDNAAVGAKAARTAFTA
jgi:2-methylisocitrate lyase-like PEP mutase family enzyme